MTQRRTWFIEDPANVARRSRRWDDRIPAIGAAYDVERYDLRQGGSVTYFRHPMRLEAAWTDVFTRFAGAGWRFEAERSMGKLRSFSACPSACDEGRVYAMMKESGGGQVTMVIRRAGPTETRRGLRLPGPCVPVRLEAAGGWVPIFDADLDRDGVLDVFVPRPSESRRVAPPGTVLPRAEVVWDAYVMRGRCGHRVGSFDAVPPSDHASAPGRRGLIDLEVQVRGGEDGSEWITQLWWFDGTQYAPVRRRGRSGRRR